LSGELKITNKIVYAKTFAPVEGLFIHTQIFEVKRLMGLPLTLVATVPDGYALTVDGADYLSGTSSINIPVSATDPVISLKLSSGISRPIINKSSVTSVNGMIRLSGLEEGAMINVYSVNGQLISSQKAKAGSLSIAARGFVVVKVTSAGQNQVFKLIVR
jgi:hypothetical protein